MMPYLETLLYMGSCFIPAIQIDSRQTAEFYVDIVKLL